MFPSSAAPQNLSVSGVGELIFSYYSDVGGARGSCFDFCLCASLSVATDVITAAVRDDHWELSDIRTNMRLSTSKAVAFLLPLFFPVAAGHLVRRLWMED